MITRVLPLSLLAVVLLFAQQPLSVEFRHVCTFGSKAGIHPPRVFNRKLAVAAVGKGTYPYGLGYPVGVATDLQHRVWITDSATASIHVFDRISGGYREIKSAGGVPFEQPTGITADDQGYIYVTDSGTGGVYVFDEKGEYDRSLVKRGQRVLDKPSAIVVSENRRTIYVADPPRNAVLALNQEGEVNRTIDMPPEISEPVALSLIDNQLYVLGGRFHKVGIFTHNGSLRAQLQWDGVGLPTAFAYDGERKRFVVANPRFMITQVFDEEGRNVGSFGRQGEGVDQVERIDSVHIDSLGMVYVVDSHHGKVLVFAESQAR